MFKSLKTHTTKLHKPWQLQNQMYIQHQRSGKPKPKKEKPPNPNLSSQTKRQMLRGEKKQANKFQKTIAGCTELERQRRKRSTRAPIEN